jgi:hypothetical protein
LREALDKGFDGLEGSLRLYKLARNLFNRRSIDIPYLTTVLLFNEELSAFGQLVDGE